ncbi:MAG: TlyA family rRNA (cytidine-2'-O)-methyltransferase [Nitrospira bacterium HGW-Nitrospira-1]|nr:MAG: TlyA family rRNA (cytidine-2'-O)-methyltransferase [Nitrospira bacterium HGW-Nitrospira-1]
MKNKERLDIILVDSGLVKSRERARALIMEGKVVVNGLTVIKAGALVNRDSGIVLKKGDNPYVGRGGLKLKPALDFFHINPKDKVVMDIGCSTGGFTDCVLKENARKVYAVDVGYGQIDWSLRQNPKVILLEKTNIRYLEKENIPDSVDLILIDVSFISLTKVLPKCLEFLDEKGEILALIKPQFEVGRELVEKGGVIKDESKRMQAVENIRIFAEAAGFETLGIFASPVRGQKGNMEYFIYLRRKING